MQRKSNHKRGPWRSACEPHFEWIVETLGAGATFKSVSEQLRSKFGISRAPSTIWAFVRRRLKGRTPPNYASLSGRAQRFITPISKAGDEANDAAYDQARERIAAAQKAKAAASATSIDPSDVYPNP